MDLAEAVATIEEHGARVIGRIVAFRDPVYAQAAWDAGRKDEVLQTPDGGMLSSYGGYTNYVHPAVQKYNLDLALEAVDAGAHDILWDYIHRPEGRPEEHTSELQSLMRLPYAVFFLTKKTHKHQ